jgi:glutamine cyclotransferase
VTRRGAALLAVSLLACSAEPGAGEAKPPESPVPTRPLRVLASHPHDPEAFTQGLLWSDGRLYESVGLYGRSALREVELESGRVVRQAALPAEEFAEGLALVGDRLVQLTWRENVVRVWRRGDFAPLARLRIEGEGWGLAYDGERLIQSDGSAVLTFRSAADLSAVRTVVVRRAGRAVPYLNELEWADGALYANVWMSDEILRIDPADGRVTAAWDASGLLDAAARSRAAELNGIAWNPAARRFYLTGKLWPRLFEVELPPPPR